MNSFDVAARVASPAVQGIVVTRDIWLWPSGCTCTIINKYSGSCASLKV
jgi:hypothetical protein